ncbi:MAG TPA: phosphoenolpyruvate--protein phosphotransferase [Actinobacteria bacterium]|nr:phosphoenolpyruvate--protein phosphotransferase [Actinomycetota bacterium]
MSQKQILQGIGVGSRAVRAEVFRLNARRALPAPLKSEITSTEEEETLTQAISSLEAKYNEKIASASGNLKEILEAQLALATDSELFEAAVQNCEDGWSASTAIQMAMNEFKELLSGADGEFGERVADLDEIVYRVIEILQGRVEEIDLPSSGKVIVVATDLTPMDTVAFTDVVAGVITEKGGPTSHTAIVCRSRDIPALVACADAATLKSGQIVMLDPDNSQAIVDGELSSASGNWWDGLTPNTSSLIPVMANIGSVEDAQKVLSAQGVGLLRTELFFLNRSTAPTLREQIELYSSVLAAGPTGEIVVRTLDAGSDKPIPFLGIGHEENPALGVRGQRVAAVAPDFYRDQLTAIAAAAKDVISTGKEITVSVMAPMIATVEEARTFATQTREAGISRVGIMIEVPSIIPLIGQLRGVIDFVSVGTNDLSQYLFAADRVNSEVAHLLNPWQPALLATLEEIVLYCADASIKTGVCGEAASDPLLALVLAGLGFDSVSASPSSVSDVNSALSCVSVSRATAVARAARSGATAREAKTAARNAL